MWMASSPWRPCRSAAICANPSCEPSSTTSCTPGRTPAASCCQSGRLSKRKTTCCAVGDTLLDWRSENWVVMSAFPWRCDQRCRKQVVDGAPGAMRRRSKPAQFRKRCSYRWKIRFVPERNKCYIKILTLSCFWAHSASFPAAVCFLKEAPAASAALPMEALRHQRLAQTRNVAALDGSISSGRGGPLLSPMNAKGCPGAPFGLPAERQRWRQWQLAFDFTGPARCGRCRSCRCRH